MNFEKSVQLSLGDVQVFPVDPPKREQKVIVKVSSPEPVNVYVVLDKDQEAAKKALVDSKAPTNPLAGKERVKDDSLEATVPAKTGFAVLLAGATKDTTVKLTITGR